MIRVKAISYEMLHNNGINMYRPHGTGDYLFLFFRTDVEVMIDSKYLRLEPNTFLLYHKDSPHFYRKLDGPFNNDWIHFEIDGEENEFFRSLEIPFDTPIRMNDYFTINRMVEDLCNENFQSGNQHEKILDVKMQALFYKLSDIYHENKLEPELRHVHYKKLLQLRYQINKFEYVNTNLNEIADKLNISSSYLSHLYKEFFHKSIGQDIILSRINYAKILLNNPEFTIADISCRCGYENIEHFSRQFKKYTGYSPRNYRINVLK